MKTFEDIRMLYEDQVIAGYAFSTTASSTIKLLDLHLEHSRLRYGRDMGNQGLPIGFFDELALHAKCLNSICEETKITPQNLLEHLGYHNNDINMYLNLAQHAITLLNMRESQNT